MTPPPAGGRHGQAPRACLTFVVTVELASQIRRAGLDAGLDGVGICEAHDFPRVRSTLEERKRQGLSGKLQFTFRNPEVASSVRRSFPWAQRLVVGARSYMPAAGAPGPPIPGTGRVARFATEDHYRGLRAGLDVVVGLLVDAGFRAAVLSDDNRLVDRAAAVRAGVGWWGKNTMVLAPKFGPWLLLGSVVTDAPLATSEPMKRDCGTCRACIPACPTGALGAPGVLDARKCLAYWSQTSGVIPVEYRRPMADRIYGCDDCIDACPPGHRVLDRARSVRRGRIDLVALLGADDRTLLARYDHFYIPRRQPRYLRRNAIVALANGGESAAVPVLAGYLGHPDWLLRLHAAWGLGRVGGSMARAALSAGARVEQDSAVRAELRNALTALGAA